MSDLPIVRVHCSRTMSGAVQTEASGNAKQPSAAADTTTGPKANGDMDGFVAVEKQRRIFKIIVIGDSNVGKTCLTYRFCGGKFPEKTEATIGVDFREKNVTVDGETIKLQLWDTAGQERFRKSMVQHYYRNVHAVVFVYDITKMSTFEGLPNWIDECDRHSLSPDIPRFLVANKCDMEERRVVATSIGQRFADANTMPFFETSAKLDEDAGRVEGLFMELAGKLKSHRHVVPLPSHYGKDKDDDDARSTVRLPATLSNQNKDGHCCQCSS